MSRVYIVTDSTADLTEEEVKQFEKNLKKAFDFVATNNKIPNL